MNYNYLREQYPEYISKIQLYQICKISPKSATYLLDNNIIPCIDTGKQTWKYRILLEDVIAYLQKRENGDRQMPKRAAPVKKQGKTKASYFDKNDESLIDYFNYIYEDYPDALTSSDIAEMLNIDRTTACKSIRNFSKRISNKFYVPKKEFLLRLSTGEIVIHSPGIQKVVMGFQLWKKAYADDEVDKNA